MTNRLQDPHHGARFRAILESMPCDGSLGWPKVPLNGPDLHSWMEVLFELKAAGFIDVITNPIAAALTPAGVLLLDEVRAASLTN